MDTEEPRLFDPGVMRVPEIMELSNKVLHCNAI